MPPDSGGVCMGVDLRKHRLALGVASRVVTMRSSPADDDGAEDPDRGRAGVPERRPILRRLLAGYLTNYP